jgi:hypothetical protein
VEEEVGEGFGHGVGAVRQVVLQRGSSVIR